MILAAIAAKRTAVQKAIMIILITLVAEGRVALLDFLRVTIIQMVLMKQTVQPSF